MSEHIRLVVGLGNPGERYQNTWHNIGARVVQRLAADLGIGFKPWKSECLIAETLRHGGLALMLPTSYMNRSGGPVQIWLRYHKIEPTRALIVYDDHDLPLGRLRIRANGSSGGHRGMEDTIVSCGTDEIPRLRIGIKIERERGDLAEQVLTPIPKSFQQNAERIVVAASEAVESVIRDGVVVAGNKFNGVDFR